MQTISCHKIQPEFLSDLNTIYVKANILSMYAKFQLQPLIGSVKKIVLICFLQKNTLHVNPAPNQILGKIHINQRTNGPVNIHLISWPSKAKNMANLW